jgi:hypothetical protein
MNKKEIEEFHLKSLDRISRALEAPGISLQKIQIDILSHIMTGTFVIAAQLAALNEHFRENT